MPIQFLRRQPHKNKHKISMQKGMITIKWKKGKESLGIGIGSDNPQSIFENKTPQELKKLKREGYGKF